MEAKIQIETGVTLDLSREDVIDCSTDYYNFYCAGGTAVGSFSYITDNGLYNTSDYPYTSGDIPVRLLTTNSL